jgi:hypothetical protein
MPAMTIQLWRADAVVLFDWPMSTDLNAMPARRPSVAVDMGW